MQAANVLCILTIHAANILWNYYEYMLRIYCAFLKYILLTCFDLFHLVHNISIVEDPKIGDVSVPGATVAEIRDQQSFVELLRLGEAHRIAANTKLNTESSRSHAILMVNNCSLLLMLLIQFSV